MKELGQVISLDGKNAIVRVNRSSACGTCNACGMGCDDKKFIDLTVLNTVNAVEKDIVELDMETPNLLLGAFIMYGIPLITMLSAIMLSYYVIAKQNTLISCISGFVAVIITFAIIRLNEDKIKKSSKFLPSISKKLSENLENIL